MMDETGRSEHRLVIVRRRDRGDPAILLLQERDAWNLPRIELPEQRSADIAELNRAVRGALGIETSVLRCLADEPGADGGPRRHLQVLEAHGDESPADARVRWVPSHAVSATLAPDSKAWQSVEAWLGGARNVDASRARE